MSRDPEALLRLYDDELRTDAETPSAQSVLRHGPLRLVTFARGRGFVTYRDLGGAGEDRVEQLVADAVEHFEADPEIQRVEWKARGHDVAPGLHEALLRHGFVEQETEAVMMGDAEVLAEGPPPRPGVVLRQVTEEADVRAMCAQADEAFGEPVSEEYAEAVLDRLRRDDGMQLWVAEVQGEVVCSGRLEPVADSTIAGIWGGATTPAWRGQGIYRALVAARAVAATHLGRTVLHSDSTPMSEPILARSGLVRVTTTTPYEWRREASSTG
ncbi:MAG: GNAT family N-acetyltransferase [Aeromicrobium erythreum]